MSPDPLFDFELPVMLRAYIALFLLPAMGFRAVREAGLVPTLYGRVDDMPVRLVAAFQDGTVGVSSEDSEFGGYTRVMPYEITDLSKEMP